MEQLVLVLHVLAAIAITVLILIQQGKGADMGASFGSGASQTLFGSRGTGNVLTRSTAILATIFFITSFGLALVAKNHAKNAGMVDVPAAVDMSAEAPAKPVDDIPSVPQNAAPATGGDIPASAPAPEQPQQ
jgi:preprotein translocase subunit SecG